MHGKKTVYQSSNVKAPKTLTQKNQIWSKLPETQSKQIITRGKNWQWKFIYRYANQKVKCLLTLPCFLNLVKVSESPTVWLVLTAAIGVNLVLGTANRWEGERIEDRVSGLFFNWKKLVFGDLKETAMAKIKQQTKRFSLGLRMRTRMKDLNGI